MSLYVEVFRRNGYSAMNTSIVFLSHGGDVDHSDDIVIDDDRIHSRDDIAAKAIAEERALGEFRDSWAASIRAQHSHDKQIARLRDHLRTRGLL